jgi:hypothetical protein
MTGFPSFLSLSKSSLCTHTPFFSLSIYPLMHIWVDSIWLLWM